MQRRMIETNFTEEDSRIEGTLRPQRLSEYVGQRKLKESLGISIEAAKQRGEPLDHLLFYGPPGLGKTTISNIIANEMGVGIKITSGPAIEKPGDMAAILNGLKELSPSVWTCPGLRWSARQRGLDFYRHPSGTDSVRSTDWNFIIRRTSNRLSWQAPQSCEFRSMRKAPWSWRAEAAERPGLLTGF